MMGRWYNMMIVLDLWCRMDDRSSIWFYFILRQMGWDNDGKMMEDDKMMGWCYYCDYEMGWVAIDYSLWCFYEGCHYDSWWWGSITIVYSYIYYYSW